MKNIKRYIVNLFMLMLLITAFTSCDEGGDPDPGGTNIEAVAGDWVVGISRNGVPQASNIHISTYNTAANLSTEMWLDDNNLYYGLKAKVNLNLAAKTFSATDSDELYYGVTVTVSDGIITKDGATPPSNTVTDAISFSVIFSDDPSGVWEFSGYRRTGFLEDE